MTETLLSGGNLLNIFFAVLFTNARLFPMTMHIIPTIKTNKVQTWKYFYYVILLRLLHGLIIYQFINQLVLVKDTKYFLD